MYSMHGLCSCNTVIPVNLAVSTARSAALPYKRFAGKDDVADALMFLLRSSSGMELKVMRRINWYKNSKIRLFHKCLKHYGRM